jgi:hypothetical protein
MYLHKTLFINILQINNQNTHMKTIELTAVEYIEFCAYCNNLVIPGPKMISEFTKGKAIITGPEEFLTKMGY